MNIWKPTGALNLGRALHTATLLPNGNVLLCGGIIAGTSTATRTAELFNPTSGSCTPTGSMFYERFNHTAALLPDGKVIVVGGTSNTTTEIYDPQSGEWFSTGRLTMARLDDHAMDVMANGRVLVAGGLNPMELPIEARVLSSVEEYDPVTQAWTTVGSMSIGRLGLTLTALLDGRVVAVGGSSGVGPLDTAELYDPQTRTWSPASGLFYPRVDHSATRLADGEVLVAGGVTVATNPPYEGEGLNACELFDPASGNWFSVGKLQVGRYSHVASLMHDGRVLATGGVMNSGAYLGLNSAEIFDPNKLVWTLTASMSTPRVSHTETPLRNRSIVSVVPGQETRVLVAGGGSATASSTTEVFETVPTGPPVLV